MIAMSTRDVRWLFFWKAWRTWTTMHCIGQGSYLQLTLGSFRGGDWGEGGHSGRWFLDLSGAPSTVASWLGGRCAR